MTLEQLKDDANYSQNVCFMASQGKVMDLVMGDNPSEVDKYVTPGHYDLNGPYVKGQLCINPMSASLLGLNNKAMQVNKGIKVPPGDKFHCTTPEKGLILYVFEAALAPSHAATITQNIQILVVREGKEIVVATLSSRCPRVQLDLVMSQGMQLSHTSRTKVVYFNACEFMPIALDEDFLRSNKEIWVTQVKPKEEIILNPVDDKKYHLLKVFSTKDTSEQKPIDLYVRYGEKVEKIGVLSIADRNFSCNLEFEGAFSVSHNSEIADVVFSGYTVSNMFTVELPGPPDVLINPKTAKECDDQEYRKFVGQRKGSGKHQVRKKTSVSLVPAPVIYCGR